MSAALDLNALASAQLAPEPHRWGYLPSALDPARAAVLRATFPQDGFWRLRHHDGEKGMDFRLRCLVPLGGDRAVEDESLDPAWRDFVDELLSDGYRDAFARALARPLDDALLELSAWRWGTDAQLGVHADLERKIASQVFYFNEGWDTSWGGCLRILRSADPDDFVEELPPALGSASLIVRSDSSWHSVPAVRGDAAEERLSVVATWQHPGSESPFWTIDDGGGVYLHAGRGTRS